MNRDFAIQNIVNVPNTTNIKRKPTYLLVLEDTSGKKGTQQRFICMDTPDTNTNFVLVKGFFSTLPEEEINKTYSEILTSVDKEHIMEMWFPTHRVVSIRSLTFSAKK